MTLNKMKNIIGLILISFYLLSCTNLGNEDDFTKDSGLFTDERDGHKYKWVKIGDQIWMAENLAYLPLITSPSVSSYSEAFCYVYDYYGDNINDAKATLNYKTYGVLYNWSAAKNMCPKGWHLPSHEEMKQLHKNVVPGATFDPHMSEYYSIAKVLKSKTGWYNNGNGTDDFGFTLLPGGGYHYTNSKFFDIGYEAILWTSDTKIENDEAALDWEFGDEGSNAEVYYNNKRQAYSVRCIKD